MNRVKHVPWPELWTKNTKQTYLSTWFFVSRDQRGRGLENILFNICLIQARLRKYSSCILFSDYEKPDNLYEQIGFSHISMIVREQFNFSLNGVVFSPRLFILFLPSLKVTTKLNSFSTCSTNYGLSHLRFPGKRSLY